MRPRRRAFVPAALTVASLALCASAIQGQSSSYHLVDHWAQLPGDTKFASVATVTAGPDGSVYVFQRADPPIMKFDASGKLLKTWGDGMFASPHGLKLDAQGNVWATDNGKEDGKGQQVLKFGPDGKLLMTLGKAGVSGRDPGVFDQPTTVAVASNGDIFVVEGHNDRLKNQSFGNHRIQKFSKDGKFIKMWGEQGSGPGEFVDPHSMVMDSRGRLLVADRGNNRIQIFDQEGRFLAEWRQFGKISGLHIVNDTLYAADSGPGAGTGVPAPGFKKGVRIGSAKDGTVTDFIEDIDPTNPSAQGPEGCAADAQGNVYASFVQRRTLMKFAKQ